MTTRKAEEMRNIVSAIQSVNRRKKIVEHQKYAEKIVARKVSKLARKGLSSLIIEPKKKYSPSLLIEQLSAMGFDMSESKMAKGKYQLKLKW